MVVCPCGVMVPTAGVGRARRGNRGTTGCFDTPATVTTQPKDPQDTPASVEKLAAAAAAAPEPSSIPRPLSRGGKNNNKGPNKGGPEEAKLGDHSSRTTLALATTESGRYVGTRPLRSNRSPTPTLHRLPQKTTSLSSSSRDNLAGGTASAVVVGGGVGVGRPTKHLPAVRTSPTSPLDNQDTGGVCRVSSARLKGPTALPRQNGVMNVLNQRMNDINSNHRRLQKQRYLPPSSQLPLMHCCPEATRPNPATKTCHQDPQQHCDDANAPTHARIYVNLPYHTLTRHEDEGVSAHETVYESDGRRQMGDDEDSDGIDGDAANARDRHGCITRVRRADEPHAIYENIHPSRKKGNDEEEAIYENIRPPRRCDQLPGCHPDEFPAPGDVTGKETTMMMVMKSSVDSLTSDESVGGDSSSSPSVTFGGGGGGGGGESSVDSSLTSEDSLVWLTDSWKYNTIKKAPEFNIFEFQDIDPPGKKNGKDMKQTGKTEKEGRKKNGEDKSETKGNAKENEKGDNARKREMTLEKGKKKLRSKLPLFGWRSDRQKNKDKENKRKEDRGGADPAVKTPTPPPQTPHQLLKPDNKRMHNAAGGGGGGGGGGTETSLTSIHRSKLQKPLAGDASCGRKDLQRIYRGDANLLRQAERERGGASWNSSAGQIRFTTKTPKPDRQEWERGSSRSSSRSSSRGSSRSPSSSPVKSGCTRKPDPMKQTAQAGTGERHRSGNMSRGLQLCGSPLISPGYHHHQHQHHRLSQTSSSCSQMAQAARGIGGGGGEGGVHSTTTTNTSSPSSAASISTFSSSSSSTSTSSSFLPRPSPSNNSYKDTRQVCPKSHGGNFPLDKNSPFPLPSPTSSSTSTSSDTSSFPTSSSSSEYRDTLNQGMHENKKDRIKGRSHQRTKVQENEMKEKKENTSVSRSSSGQSSHCSPNTSVSRSSSDQSSHCSPNRPSPDGGTRTNEQTMLHRTRRREADLGTHSGTDFDKTDWNRDERQHVSAKFPQLGKHPHVPSYNTIPVPEKRKRREKGVDGDGKETKPKERRNEGKGNSLLHLPSISPSSAAFQRGGGGGVGGRGGGGGGVGVGRRSGKRCSIEDEEEDKEVDDGRGVFPASLTLQEVQDPASQPESNGKKPKTHDRSTDVSRSRRETDTNGHFLPRYPAAPIPSPTPSCPPSVLERQGTSPSFQRTFQYHSLPQLYPGDQDYLVTQRPLERGLRSQDPSFKPYYMSDLCRTPLPGISRSRRYSQTSLIDQALESLELLPLIANEEQMSQRSKRYSQPILANYDTYSSSSSSKSVASASSPVLPPLPAGVLDGKCLSPRTEHENEIISPQGQTNLASVCILSLDLTVDCEEFNAESFKVVNITNDSLTNQDVKDEVKSEDEEMTFEFDEDEKDDDGDDSSDSEPENKEEDTFSNKSISVSIDEKYYENDNYDNTDETSCDFISEEQQRKLDQSIALLSGRQRSDTSKLTDKRDIVTEDDDEDFIEIDCDVKPMETLKRPLVYGYGTGPVRALPASSFLEKRLSVASDTAEYLEMDFIDTLHNIGVPEEIRKKSESCMNLRETYWDYWQAKKGITGQISHSSSSRNSSTNCSPGPASCPSEQFCYDPEVLLAHVRCPKSLEDATFKQYSAYVKSHIYDYFGNVQDTLNDYRLSSAQRDWICSQPDLLPSKLRQRQTSGNPPLDYSSEPELTHGNREESSYEIPPHLSAKRAPPPRPPPPPLQSKDPSQDSGTWTYLQSSQESAAGFAAAGAYPVPLPRSTSSLSHIGPGSYNPWLHLLPDVTPPRTPRHSLYYTSAATGPASHSASSSPSRGSLTSIAMASETIPRAAVATLDQSKAMPHSSQLSSSRTPTKRSFFPSLSKVVKSPLRKPFVRSSKACTREDSMDVLSELPTVHPSIQKRTHTTTSSKSSSSSSSSSSASSKDSVTTVIPATARNKGQNWLMRHFGGAKSKMAAV